MDLIPVYYAPYSRQKLNTMKTKKKAHKRSKSNTYMQRFAKAPQSTGKKLQLYLNKKDEEGNPIPTHRFKTSFKEPQSGVEELCGLEIEHILKEFNSKNRDIRTSRVDHLVTVFEKDHRISSLGQEELPQWSLEGSGVKSVGRSFPSSRIPRYYRRR